MLMTPGLTFSTLIPSRPPWGYGDQTQMYGYREVMLYKALKIPSNCSLTSQFNSDQSKAIFTLQLITAFKLHFHQRAFLTSKYSIYFEQSQSSPIHTKCLPHTTPRPCQTHHLPTPPSPVLQPWRATHPKVLSGTRHSRRHPRPHPPRPRTPKQSRERKTKTRRNNCTMKPWRPTLPCDKREFECECTPVVSSRPTSKVAMLLWSF